MDQRVPRRGMGEGLTAALGRRPGGALAEEGDDAAVIPIALQENVCMCAYMYYVCMYECVDMWICGYVDMWMYTHMIAVGGWLSN